MEFDWVKVEGESMSPVLRTGDLIGVQWHDGRGDARPSPGELVLGRTSDNVWLVHRLVRAEPDGCFVLKGDASMATERLAPHEIWGRVVAVQTSQRPPRELRNTWLDRAIAALSRRRLRRTVFALALVRRAVL